MTDGKQWESAAEVWLHRRGLRLLHRNYRCRLGEIDLVMQEGSVLVFIEVRSRQHAGYGGAAASIDRHKQRRIVLAAQHYLQRLERMPVCRFDVVLYEGKMSEPVWLRNAFQAD